MIEGILAGGAVFLVGLVTGRFLPARRRIPKPVKPVCGCKHHYSMHDPATGACHGLMDGAYAVVRDEKGRPVKDAYGDVQKATERVPCTCQKYTGPEPLPEYYAPEIGA